VTDIVKTRRDLVDQVLENIGVLAEGQTPSAEQVDRVDKKIDPAFADLNARGVMYIGDTEEIPVEIFLQLADVVAYRCIQTFGVSTDDEVKLTRRKEAAEKELKTIARPAKTRKVLSTDSALRQGAAYRGT
jgi:hypothetical protein